MKSIIVVYAYSFQNKVSDKKIREYIKELKKRPHVLSADCVVIEGEKND